MSKQNINRMLLDLDTFVTLLIVSAPRATGNTVHEWLAVALSWAIVVHLLMNWKWVVKITSRLFAKTIKGSLIKYVLNWSLFANGIMIVLSGLIISQTVVPVFGINLPSSFSWRQLHSLSTNAIMVLMGLHVAVHWPWIVGMFKNIFASRVSSQAVSQPLLMYRKDASQ